MRASYHVGRRRKFKFKRRPAHRREELRSVATCVVVCSTVAGAISGVGAVNSKREAIAPAQILPAAAAGLPCRLQVAVAGLLWQSPKPRSQTAKRGPRCLCPAPTEAARLSAQTLHFASRTGRRGPVEASEICGVDRTPIRRSVPFVVCKPYSPPRPHAFKHEPTVLGDHSRAM